MPSSTDKEKLGTGYSSASHIARRLFQLGLKAESGQPDKDQQGGSVTSGQPHHPKQIPEQYQRTTTTHGMPSFHHPSPFKTVPGPPLLTKRVSLPPVVHAPASGSLAHPSSSPGSMLLKSSSPKECSSPVAPYVYSRNATPTSSQGGADSPASPTTKLQTGRASKGRRGTRGTSKENSFWAPQLQASHVPVALQTHDGGRSYYNTWDNPFAASAVADSFASDDFTPRHAVADCLTMLRHTQQQLQSALTELATTRAELAAREAMDAQTLDSRTSLPAFPPLSTGVPHVAGTAVGQVWMELQQARDREEALKKKALQLISDNLSLVNALEAVKGADAQTNDATAIQARIRNHLRFPGSVQSKLDAPLISRSRRELSRASAGSDAAPEAPSTAGLGAALAQAGGACDVGRSRRTQPDQDVQGVWQEALQGLGGHQQCLSALLRDMIQVGTSLLNEESPYPGATDHSQAGEPPEAWGHCCNVDHIKHSDQPINQLDGCKHDVPASDTIDSHALALLDGPGQQQHELNAPVQDLATQDTEIKMLSLQPMLKTRPQCQSPEPVIARYDGYQSEDEGEPELAEGSHAEETLDDASSTCTASSPQSVPVPDDVPSTLLPAHHQLEGTLLVETTPLPSLKVPGPNPTCAAQDEEQQPWTPDAQHPPHVFNASPGMGDGETTASFHKWHAEPFRPLPPAVSSTSTPCTHHLINQVTPAHTLKQHDLSLMSSHMAGDDEPQLVHRPSMTRHSGHAAGRLIPRTHTGSDAVAGQHMMSDLLVAAFCTSLVFSGAWASHWALHKGAAEHPALVPDKVGVTTQQGCQAVHEEAPVFEPAQQPEATPQPEAPAQPGPAWGNDATHWGGPPGGWEYDPGPQFTPLCQPAVQVHAYGPIPNPYPHQGLVWLNPTQLHTASGTAAISWIANVQCDSHRHSPTCQPSCAAPAVLIEEPQEVQPEGLGWVLAFGAAATVAFGACSLLAPPARRKHKNRM